MNEFQFCYWLMGVFELGEIKEFSNKQLILVKEHLNLVVERKYTFCNWLEGFLDSNGLEKMSPEKTSKVLLNLQNEFLNTIDRSYPQEKQSALYAAHEGREVSKVIEKKEPPKFEVMC